MRKVLTVALLAVFVVGITGLLTVASSVVTYNVPSTEEEIKALADTLTNEYTGLTLEADDLEGFEKVRVVSPEGIKDGTYEVKNESSNGKVLVIVDPIHVTE